MSTPRRIDGPGFGHNGGSNLADYLGATERAHQIELEMEPGERLVEIPVDLIDRSPFQARTNFDEEAIAALGEDIKENGLNHPVAVREGVGGRYELIAGERRWLATKLVGLTHIVARVRPLDDFAAHLVGVSENNRRANLSPWEMSLEAVRLLEHAQEAHRPHTQRDLARYLNRNVSLVNQQLAIAGAVTAEFLAGAQISQEALCNLPHVTLHRISKIPEERRLRALREAIRMQQPRPDGAKGDGDARKISSPTDKVSEAESWKRVWEKGGFRFRLREPLCDLNPEQAARYVRQLAPAFGGLAARVAESPNEQAVMQWETPHGWLLFVRSSEGVDKPERGAPVEELRRLLAALS